MNCKVSEKYQIHKEISARYLVQVLARSCAVGEVYR